MLVSLALVKGVMFQASESTGRGQCACLVERVRLKGQAMICEEFDSKLEKKVVPTKIEREREEGKRGGGSQ